MANPAPVWLIADPSHEAALQTELARLGFTSQASGPGARAVLLDFRRSDAADVLAKLKREVETHHLPVIALVVGSKTTDFTSPAELGADGVVAVDRLELELAARVDGAVPEPVGKRLGDFFDTLTLGFALVGRNAELFTLNLAGARMLGVSQARNLADLFDALSPVGEQAMEELLLAARDSRSGAEVDIAVRKVNGEVATLAISSAPLGDAANPGAVLLCFRDVTRARSMQGELRKTKEFLERLIDQASDAIIAADMSGAIILYNQGAERMYGYSAAEAIGRLNVRSLYHPPGIAKELMRKIRAAEYGGPGKLESTPVEIVTKSGERVPVSMTAALITEDLGGRQHEVGTVGILSDLRERVRLELKLSATQAQLEQREKTALVAELAGTAAHELNQPLTSIMGYAELLRRRLRDDDPNVRAIDIVYREAERMAEIVRKIGKITKYETKPYVGGARIVDLERSTNEAEDA